MYSFRIGPKGLIKPYYILWCTQSKSGARLDFSDKSRTIGWKQELEKKHNAWSLNWSFSSDSHLPRVQTKHSTFPTISYNPLEKKQMKFRHYLSKIITDLIQLSKELLVTNIVLISNFACASIFNKKPLQHLRQLMAKVVIPPRQLLSVGLIKNSPLSRQELVK